MGTSLRESVTFLNYAEALRIIASEKSDSGTRQGMQLLAEMYDQLAKALEESYRTYLKLIGAEGSQL